MPRRSRAGSPPARGTSLANSRTGRPPTVIVRSPGPAGASAGTSPNARRPSGCSKTVKAISGLPAVISSRSDSSDAGFSRAATSVASTVTTMAPPRGRFTPAETRSPPQRDACAPVTTSSLPSSRIWRRTAPPPPGPRPPPHPRPPPGPPRGPPPLPAQPACGPLTPGSPAGEPGRRPRASRRGRRRRHGGVALAGSTSRTAEGVSLPSRSSSASACARSSRRSPSCAAAKADAERFERAAAATVSCSACACSRSSPTSSSRVAR